MTKTRTESTSAYRRAGKALLSTLVYALLIIAGVAGMSASMRALNINLHPVDGEEQPLSIASTVLMIGIIMAVTFALARFQRRPMLDFGLRLNGSFKLALRGAVAGLVLSSALMGTLIAVGAVKTQAVSQLATLSGLYAVVWAVGFFAVAFMEETLFRGYPLIRLSEGIGFWPAAFFTSLVFGALHLGNDGETYVASVNAVLLALIFCFSVRVTGSLWWAIGFHGAWDWSESFLFGCSDSGIKVTGRLFDVVPLSTPLLSGGSAGPEGSVLALGVIAIAWLILLRARSLRSNG